MSSSAPRLRIGIVGLGNAAAMMLPSLLAHPGIAVTAAADPRPAARDRFEADIGGTAFATAEDMYGSPLIDAVYIATPHQFHAANAIAAAGHGKHVLVEKPMALTLRECASMIEAADRSGTVLVVGHSQAFSPAVLKMRAMIDAGDVGPPRMITNLVYTNYLYRPRRPEELDTRSGGGIVYNQLPHQIDVARALVPGALRRVSALAGAWDRRRPTEAAAAALLTFEGGVAASLVYSGYDHFDSDELHGWVSESGAEKTPTRSGAARRRLAEGPQQAREEQGFSGRGVLTAPPGKVRPPHFGFLLVTCEGADMRASADGLLVYDDDGRHEIVLPPGRAFPNRDAVADELYDAIVRGTPPRHDGRWGMATMAACLAVLESSRRDAEIRFEPPLAAATATATAHPHVKERTADVSRS